MLKLLLKNQECERGQGFTFSLKPLALSLRPLAFSLFLFFFCLINANTTFAATVNLSWNPPTTNTDGSQLTDLAGYKIYYGTISGYYTQQIDVNNVTTYTLSNLSDGTSYYIAITAYNISLRESDYSNERCFNSTGNCSSDTTSPVISGINAGSITSTSANISWSTNEPSDTQVEYGATTSYGYNTTLNTSLVASHSQTINGLSPSTLYHYRVRSRDAAGNLAISGDSTFTTASSPPPPDTTPPIISNISTSAINSSGATITWTTNEAADTQVEYGLTTAYGYTTALNSTLSTSHSRTLTNLSPATLYHYRVRSRDAAGNLAVSGDNTFTTLNTADSTPPVISNINASNITTSSAVINWTTNEASTSQVEYGTTTQYGFSTSINTNLTASHSVTLTGLTPNTLYHYRVRSRDGSNNLSISGDNTFSTLQGSDNTPPSDVQNFAAAPGNGDISLSWTNPTDADFIGVRIRYRTDGQYPANINDGVLLGDFTGNQGEAKSTLHSGLQNGTTYYYSAFSYDANGNYSSTAHTSATPSTGNTTNISKSSGDEITGGGCGFVKGDNNNGKGPRAKGQGLSLMIMLILMLAGIAAARRLSLLKNSTPYSRT